MKKIFYLLTLLFAGIALEAGNNFPRSRYIDLIAKTLTAYSTADIENYCHKVDTGGLKEHGFPRLTANIGILIAHGKRLDLKPLFVRMMDICCREIPIRKKAGNEFSIKEIVFCLMELEKQRTFPPVQLEKWKSALKKVTVANCYRVYAVSPTAKVNNWAAFAMVSEWMRYFIGAADKDMDFIETQAASQWQFVDVNGMYRDPNEPLVYDFVTRGLFAQLFYFGYRGKYFARWDKALASAGKVSLLMLSAAGEMPFGGRSNQFLHNEATAAMVMEYEARRAMAAGDKATAAKFRGAAKALVDNVELCLALDPISHVKNRFPRDSRYGCETYAYFDKYMITAASALYVAYLFSDDTIPATEMDLQSGMSWQSSDHFHKLFLRAGNYSAQNDYRADYKYDASGMGRLQFKGAPAAICLSVPGTHTPHYKIFMDKPVPFALTPMLYDGKVWLSGAAPEAVHSIVSHSAGKESAAAVINCSWGGKKKVKTTYLLDANGLTVKVSGSGKIGYMLPAFSFDGKVKPEISQQHHTLTIKYQGYECVYTVTGGTIADTGDTGGNRNGHYRIFRAEGNDDLTVNIRIGKSVR